MCTTRDYSTFCEPRSTHHASTIGLAPPYRLLWNGCLSQVDASTAPGGHRSRTEPTPEETMNSQRPSPASPWVYDTRLLSRQAGVMKRVQETLTSDERMGLDVLAVLAGEPIRLNLRLESVVEGVLV